MVKLNWKRLILSKRIEYPFTEKWQSRHKRDYAEWYAKLPIGAVAALREVEAENPYSDYREPVDQDSHLFARFYEQWAIEHNTRLDSLASFQAEQWRESRVERIRHVQSVRRLETAVAKYHRRNSTPQFIEPSTKCTHPMPAINLQGIDTTETEIQTLLATIRDADRRADVRAECWIVRAEHPSSPALHVFNRAVKNCQMVSRGIYSVKERNRQLRHGRDIQPTDDDCRKWETQSAATIWRDSIADCNRQERYELACVLLKTQLGRETLDALLQGKSRAEIAQQLGISQATLSRRFAALELATV